MFVSATSSIILIHDCRFEFPFYTHIRFEPFLFHQPLMHITLLAFFSQLLKTPLQYIFRYCLCVPTISFVLVQLPPYNSSCTLHLVVFFFSPKFWEINKKFFFPLILILSSCSPNYLKLLIPKNRTNPYLAPFELFFFYMKRSITLPHLQKNVPHMFFIEILRKA